MNSYLERGKGGFYEKGRLYGDLTVTSVNYVNKDLLFEENRVLKEGTYLDKIEHYNPDINPKLKVATRYPQIGEFYIFNIKDVKSQFENTRKG